MKILKTENQVIKFVQDKTKYFLHGFRLPDGTNGGNYAVNLGNKVYHSDDVGEITDMILADLELMHKNLGIDFKG